eukprot:165831_1
MSSEETTFNTVRANIRIVVDQVKFDRIFSDYSNWQDLKSILNDEEFRSNYDLSLVDEKLINVCIRVAIDMEANQQATSNSLGSVGSKLWNFVQYYVPSGMNFGHGTHSQKEKTA